MSARKRRKRKNGAVSIAIIVLTFLAVMSIQIFKLKQKEAIYADKEAELQETYELETERAQEIEALADYVQSDQYIIDMAHSKLGLAYDNEIIFKESK